MSIIFMSTVLEGEMNVKMELSFTGQFDFQFL